MSQYYPANRATEYENLKQGLDVEEYYKVVKRMSELGITKGYVQEMESASNYRPDFENRHPFE